MRYLLLLTLIYELPAHTHTPFPSNTQKKLPYGLISDPDRILITALGAGKGGKTNRSHFIFEKGTGKLIDSKIPVKPVDRCVTIPMPILIL